MASKKITFTQALIGLIVTLVLIGSVVSYLEPGITQMIRQY